MIKIIKEILCLLKHGTKLIYELKEKNQVLKDKNYKLSEGRILSFAEFRHEIQVLPDEKNMVTYLYIKTRYIKHDKYGRFLGFDSVGFKRTITQLQEVHTKSDLREQITKEMYTLYISKVAYA